MLKPPHAIALRLALPYRAWLSALGMQLVAHSTGTGKVIASSSTLHHSSSSNSSRQYKNLTTASGEVTPGLNRQASKHQCWQPVLIAYGSEDSGQESMSSGREVVRTGPAAMSLWAIESHGKHIGVLSDPSCYVQLRCCLPQCNMLLVLLMGAVSTNTSSVTLHAEKTRMQCSLGVASAWLHI